MVLSQGGMSENMDEFPHQGSSVVKKCDRIKSWKASHEEKLWRVPTKLEDKIQVHAKRSRRGLHRPMLMDGGEGKKLKKCVVEDIEQQQDKREKNDGIKEEEGVCSPMYKTR